MTVFDFCISVVPRELRQEKPVGVDPFVEMNVYGSTVYESAAVPPGLIAEMYINFWYLGIVVGPLLLGITMKIIHNALIGNAKNANFVIIYVTALQHFGLSLMSSGFLNTMIGICMLSLPIILVMYFIVSESRAVISLVKPGLKVDSSHG